VELQFSDASARGLAASVEAAVRDGSLSPGDALPSVRAFAAAARVSPTTAASALAALRRRGVIVTRERRRSYVSPRPPVSVPMPFAAIPPGVRDLASGHPDPELLPDLGDALTRLKVRPRSYDEEPVIPELAQLARADFAESGVHAEHLCLASGALDGVERVLSANVAAGDGVAVEDPCYGPLLDLVRAMGLVPVPVAIDDRGFRPTSLGVALSLGVRAVILTPRAQNPSGAALDPTRARELAKLLSRERGLLIVEDDHQGPIAGVPGLSLVAGQNRWARIRSVTKALGPDLRLAFITGDDTTVSRTEGRFAVGPGWVSGILQQLIVELVRARSTKSTLERATRAYAERRIRLLQALRAQGLAVSGRSGFNLWVPVPDETAVVAALLERGWAVTPGQPFRLESPPAIRVTTATLQSAEAERFAADLRAVLAPARRRRVA
jgi:DNA-binding transcriptional MocR family regulator